MQVVFTAGRMGGIAATMASGTTALSQDRGTIGEHNDLPLMTEFQGLVMITPLKDHHGRVLHVEGHDFQQTGIHTVHKELHTLDHLGQGINTRNALIKEVDRIEVRGLPAKDLCHMAHILKGMQGGATRRSAGKEQMGNFICDQNGTGTGRSIGHIGQNVFHRS